MTITNDVALVKQALEALYGQMGWEDDENTPDRKKCVEAFKRLVVAGGGKLDGKWWLLDAED